MQLSGNSLALLDDGAFSDFADLLLCLIVLLQLTCQEIKSARQFRDFIPEKRLIRQAGGEIARGKVN